MTRERLQPHLEAWLQHGGAGRVHAVHLDGDWTGADQLLVDGQYVDVHVCASELAVRERLSEPRPAGRTTVLLCRSEIRGADVLARVAKRRVLRLHAWDAIPLLFGVSQIDPALLEAKWMAEALVEAAPPGGYEPTAAQALDADRAWRALLVHRYGIDPAGGLPALLDWAQSEDTRRLTQRDPPERAAVVAHLGGTFPGADPVLALVAAGAGEQAWPLGLAVRVVLDGTGGEARAAARALLSVRLGGWSFADRDARAWATAAEERVGWWLAEDSPAGRATLQAADQAVVSLHAEPLVAVSDHLSAGLRARLADLGTALARSLAAEADAAEVAAAADLVRRHRLTDHHELASMVVRAVRWLAAPASGGAGFADLARAHAADHAYADWARTALRIATGEPGLDEPLRGLVAAVDQRRRQQDSSFGAALAAHVGHAAQGGPVMGVEEVLDRVVAPLAEQHPVLLLVLDGMSHRVACELMEDVARRGWIELRPAGAPGRVLVLSALPSVTNVSRASLLSGALTTGTARNEARAFAAHTGLGTASTASKPPLLVHKGGLEDPHGGLAADLRSELASDRRVIGAVVNAIDDHLARDDQLAAPWSTTYIPLLRLLLDDARAAGRLVVVASDHGHVLDFGGSYRKVGGEHGERHRAAGTAGEGEVLVEGRRVLGAGGRRVLAVDETIRYSPRKHGYHGGASPQEVLAPLLVLAPGLGDPIDGWVESAYDAPAWWTGDGPAATPAEPSVVEEPHGQLGLIAAEEPAPGWIVELMSSDAFATQRALAGRSRVPEERVVAILTALSGGKLLHEALARRVGVAPLRLRGTLAVMRQLLNVDGYPVLSVDEESGDVALDVPLLRQQFELEPGT